MIQTLKHNDAVECINLMNKYSFHAHYERDETLWIEHLLNHIKEANLKNPHFMAIGDFNSDGYLDGFLLGSTFNNYYNKKYVMDIKDCILEEDNKLNVRTAIRLFNAAMDHIKEHGGIHWRADSIRDGEAGLRYAEFLNKKYNAKIHYGVRGIIT